MIFGMSLSTFTSLHVLISLVALSSGFVSVYGMMKGRELRPWTSVFLFTTTLTSATGFLFPFDHLDPALIVGIISLSVLAIAIGAKSAFGLVRGWRWIFVVGAITALYLNAFVFVVQAFNKLPLLHALAPNGTEAPFVIAQAILFAGYFAASFFAIRGFRPVMLDSLGSDQSRA